MPFGKWDSDDFSTFDCLYLRKLWLSQHFLTLDENTIELMTNQNPLGSAKHSLFPLGESSHLHSLLSVLAEQGGRTLEDLTASGPRWAVSPLASNALPTLHQPILSTPGSSSAVKLHWITPRKVLQHFIDTRFHSFTSDLELIYIPFPELSSRFLSGLHTVPLTSDPRESLWINCAEHLSATDASW